MDQGVAAAAEAWTRGAKFGFDMGRVGLGRRSNQRVGELQAQLR